MATLREMIAQKMSQGLSGVEIQKWLWDNGYTVQWVVTQMTINEIMRERKG